MGLLNFETIAMKIVQRDAIRYQDTVDQIDLKNPPGKHFQFTLTAEEMSRDCRHFNCSHIIFTNKCFTSFKFYIELP